MKPFINQAATVLLLAFYVVIFFCVAGCISGCTNDNAELGKAKALVEKFESLEEEFNLLASRSEDSNADKQQRAERITKEIGNYHNEMTRDYISKGQVSESKLIAWEEALNNFSNQYDQLKGTPKKDIEEPDNTPQQLDTDTDSDGDGVLDKDDQCKNQYGERKDGCPRRDTDGDGVYDEEDKCPKSKGTAANKGCPKKTTSTPRDPQDSDGDGVYNIYDDCPNTRGAPTCKGCPDKDTDADGICDQKDQCPNIFGQATYNGCPPPPPPEMDSDNDGYPDSKDNCPNRKGIEPDGCPIECNSLTRFAPIKLSVECKKELRTGKLQIRPSTDLVLEEFRLVANDNGTINYYIKDLSGRNLNNRTQSNLNAGPNTSQIRTSDLLLKKGRTYDLIVETASGSLTFVADSCANTNFSNSNVELRFTGEPFIHQLTFCKK